MEPLLDLASLNMRDRAAALSQLSLERALRTPDPVPPGRFAEDGSDRANLSHVQDEGEDFYPSSIWHERKHLQVL
jgi:hypothetical protein